MDKRLVKLIPRGWKNGFAQDHCGENHMEELVCLKLFSSQSLESLDNCYPPTSGRKVWVVPPEQGREFSAKQAGGSYSTSQYFSSEFIISCSAI